jgi:choline dehydrogenase-like flavoprotein
MQRTFAGIIEAMGGRVVAGARGGLDALDRPGEVIHEVGVARMGASPKDSALDGSNRAWDVKNLYVVDGASFVSNPDKNPTLTIMALAWRAADHLMGEMKRRHI